MSDKWERSAVIANWIVAAIAVAGFVASQSSSRKVSEALVRVTEGMTSLTTPLVKWAGFAWYSDGVISCTNPCPC